MAPIDFFYHVSRYGTSGSKYEECQFGTLWQYKMDAKIEDGRQNRGNLLVLFYEKRYIKKIVFYVLKRVTLKFGFFIAIIISKWPPKSKMKTESRWARIWQKVPMVAIDNQHLAIVISAMTTSEEHFLKIRSNYL